MNSPKKLALIFLLFGILGWILESLLKQAPTYDRMLYNLFGIKLPFLFIYALAGLFLVLLREHIDRIPLLLRILAMAIIVTAYELISGLLGQLTGYRYWDYSSHPLNILGYISLYSFFWWVIWMTAFDTTYSKLRKRAR